MFHLPTMLADVVGPSYSDGVLTLADGATISIGLDYIGLGLKVVCAIAAAGLAIVGARYAWGIIKSWLNKAK